MVVFVAHGSRDARWRASVEEAVGVVAAVVGKERVRLAYMDHAPPTLMDVVESGMEAGEREIRVAPLFLASEGHVERDIEPLVEEVRGRWSELKVELLPPLGRQPGFLAALCNIAEGHAE